MHARLERTKSALRRDNMLLKDGKQQVSGLTKEVRGAWRHYGEITLAANDPGVYHYGYNDKRPGMGKGLQTTSRTKVTDDTQQLRGAMMASVVYGRCLYGSECHYITKRQTHQMRRTMCTATGRARMGASGCSPNTAGHGNPKEPALNEWSNAGRRKKGTTYQVPQGYWEQLQGTTRKQGPHSLLRRTLETYGVDCPRPDLWSYKGRRIPVRGNHSIATQMTEIERRALRERQAKRRMHVRSLEQGMDQQRMQLLQIILRSPKDRPWYFFAH